MLEEDPCDRADVLSKPSLDRVEHYPVREFCGGILLLPPLARRPLRLQRVSPPRHLPIDASAFRDEFVALLVVVDVGRQGLVKTQEVRGLLTGALYRNSRDGTDVGRKVAFDDPQNRRVPPPVVLWRLHSPH